MITSLIGHEVDIEDSKKYMQIFLKNIINIKWLVLLVIIPY